MGRGHGLTASVVTALALEWRNAARADLLAIVDYISDDNPDAARRLMDEIEDKASMLPEHPKLYRLGRVAGTREMVVRPNYIVVYAEDAVVILRVLHATRQWPQD
jgi:addiction module RelE/StbE family toxin